MHATQHKRTTADTGSVNVRLARGQLHRLVRWLVSITDHVRTGIFNIREDFAVTVSAMLLKPRYDAIGIEAALLKESKCMAERVVARVAGLIQVVKQVPQVLLWHRNGREQLLSLLQLPSLLQLCFARVFAHDALTI